MDAKNISRIFMRKFRAQIYRRFRNTTESFQENAWCETMLPVFFSVEKCMYVTRKITSKNRNAFSRVYDLERHAFSLASIIYSLKDDRRTQ